MTAPFDLLLVAKKPFASKTPFAHPPSVGSQMSKRKAFSLLLRKLELMAPDCHARVLGELTHIWRSERRHYTGVFSEVGRKGDKQTNHCHIGLNPATSPQMKDNKRELLLRVERAFRYAGGEVGSRKKDLSKAEVKICLAFPDVYEIGTSHIGLSILYHHLNDLDFVAAERAFAPWADMDAELRNSGEKLFSLESSLPLCEFDVLGISLGYELTYTNALNIIELGGIPVFARDRKEGDPLVVAGGPCAYNPFPVLDFFDAFAIGDGESVSVELAAVVREAKRENLSRRETLERVSKIKGIFVPGMNEQSVHRRVEPDLNEVSFPTRPIVPYAAVQQRLAVEAARGCTRGCRFCQAGYIYRPVRQRDLEHAVKIASEGLVNTGHEELSFLSLSIGDWSPLCPALSALHAGAKFPFDAGLPSLRAESLTAEMLKFLGSARSGSFTLAPEAATERLRAVINKGNTDADLFASVERAFQSGWHAIKLYFMIGLPTETQADLDAIVEVSNRCLSIGKKYHRKPEVTVSTSIFIPKAHTPFQWERQMSYDEAIQVQAYFKKNLRRPGMYYRWHHAKMSLLEGVFSRGGAELCNSVYAAFKAGARFDGWDEKFNFETWQNAFEANGINFEAYLSERPREHRFAWDEIAIGPSREFLLRELDKSRELAPTEDCTNGPCSNCGLCDMKTLKNRVANREESEIQPQPMKEQQAPDAQVFNYRLRYTKLGPSAYLGGVEVADVLRYAVRTSLLPTTYSVGFRPRVRISVGPALAVGIESHSEFFDVELSKKMEAADVASAFNGRLPEGMNVLEAVALEGKGNSIQDSSAAYVYELDISREGIDARAAVAAFEKTDELKFNVRRGKREKLLDIKTNVVELAVKSDAVLKAVITCSSESPRPNELLECVFKLSPERARLVKAIKKEVIWK